MKIFQAIKQLDDLIQNTYSTPNKVEWLSKLDNMVKKQIVDTHEGAAEITFTGYDENTDPNTELLVPAPHDNMYLQWLEAQIHYHNGEYDRYNNAIIMFNTTFGDYANHYNRTHMPKSEGKRFLF